MEVKASLGWFSGQLVLTACLLNLHSCKAPNLWPQSSCFINCIHSVPLHCPQWQGLCCCLSPVSTLSPLVLVIQRDAHLCGSRPMSAKQRALYCFCDEWQWAVTALEVRPSVVRSTRAVFFPCLLVKFYYSTAQILESYAGISLRTYRYKPVLVAQSQRFSATFSLSEVSVNLWCSNCALSPFLKLTDSCTRSCWVSLVYQCVAKYDSFYTLPISN